MSTARSTDDGPWAWQSKAALRRIADACDNRSDKPYVLAVYLALTWYASNRQAESFQLSKHKLSAESGAGYRKVSDILKLLTEIGVITSKSNFIDGSKAQGENTYTLCSVCTTPGTVCTPPVHGPKNASVPRLVEESLEESPELAPAVAGKALKPAKAPTKPKERNPLIDALAAVGGADPAQVTASAWGAIGRALKEIKQVCRDLTPEEINRRARNYRLHMPNAMLTASALKVHWGTCEHPPQSAQSSQPSRNYQPFTT